MKLEGKDSSSFKKNFVINVEDSNKKVNINNKGFEEGSTT
jgi:hypothetical protein